MLKLKIGAYISTILGTVSILWIIYDYIILTNTAYKPEDFYSVAWRNVSLGFVPIVLFHISAFITMYFLFGYIRKQKELLKAKPDSKNQKEDEKTVIK